MDYRTKVMQAVPELEFPEETGMSYQDVAQQTLVEHGMLKHLMEAIRSTVAWQVQGDDNSRKLSTLRFIVQSFHRHLEHLMAMEENDGYMDGVMETCPRLARSVQQLREEHESLRRDLRPLVNQLERISPEDKGTFENICGAFLQYLNHLDIHVQKEVKMIQEAFQCDGGGEG